MPDWSDDDLRQLVSSPESESLEFKRDTLPAPHLARVISAFANSQGGRLVLGVDEQEGAIGVRNIDATHRELERTVGLLQPTPRISWEDADLDGHPLVIVNVDEGEAGPYLAPDGVLLRRNSDGGQVPLTAPELAQALESVEPEKREQVLEDTLAEMNKRLNDLYEKTAGGFEAAERGRHWKAQLPDWIASGAIGTIFGVVATLLLGG